MKVLVCEDEVSLRIALKDELTDARHAVVAVGSAEEAIELLDQGPFDLVVSDLVLPRATGLDVLKHIRGNDYSAEFVLITAYGAVDSALEALKLGAVDYLCKPFDLERLVTLTRSIAETIRLRAENDKLKSQLIERHRFHTIIGRSPAMQRLFDLLEVVCESDCTVVVVGETGTGKQVVAEAIHYNSPRAEGPFVTVSCAALPSHLLESELFGHEKGAFTGAVKEKHGRFEAADKGTLFLDEIDDIPLDLQVKLLRFIQTGEYERVGGERTLRAEVRIVASSKVKLADLLERGLLRRDLYYRLNVVQIHLPPLRERREDIGALTDHFLRKYAADRTLKLEPEIYEQLFAHSWGGNVRELEHTIERLVLLARNGEVDSSLIPGEMGTASRSVKPFAWGRLTLPEHLHAVEKEILIEAKRRAGSNRARMAELLGIPLPTLKSKLTRFSL